MTQEELMSQVQNMIPPIRLKISGTLFVQNPPKKEESQEVNNGEVKSSNDKGRE